MKWIKKISEKLEDFIWWLEDYCWWLPMAIGIIAIVFSCISAFLAIGFQLEM